MLHVELQEVVNTVHTFRLCLDVFDKLILINSNSFTQMKLSSVVSCDLVYETLKVLLNQDSSEDEERPIFIPRSRLRSILVTSSAPSPPKAW